MKRQKKKSSFKISTVASRDGSAVRVFAALTED